MISVTYLDHSGFAVTTPTAVLVFDYFKDPNHKLQKVLADKSHVPVVFFVTKHHDGKFDTSIFELAQNRKCTYVLPNDILSDQVPQKGLQVAWMAAGDSIEQIEGIKSVRAFASTGPGVSFVVTLPSDQVIFHGANLGELPWSRQDIKHVVREEDKEKKEIKKFEKVINQIAEVVPEITVAFFPVDSRTGAEYTAAAELLLTKIKVDNFFPIHMWGEPSLACDFNTYVPAGSTTKCYCLDSPGKTVEIK